MPSSKIISVKYVFLDVVAYTNRTIEAQCYIIDALNRIVKGAVNRHHISGTSVIYIPTGDGMCIALLGTDLAYDIHVTIAKEILRRIRVNNSRVKDKWKKFAVRVGINQCADNVITDVNGNRNVAGAGINNARRIMDLADASQILVSSTVYEDLHPRKEYYHAFSWEYITRVKHGIVLKTHQLIKPDTDWLNTSPPSSFVTTPQPEPKLTKLAAYYFAHLIKNKTFILSKLKEYSPNNNLLRLLIWFLAKDSESESRRSPYDTSGYRPMPDTGSDTIEGQFKWFNDNIDMHVAIEISYDLVGEVIDSSTHSDYFEDDVAYLILKPSGEEKLKEDWPEIWDAFELSELRS